jgi:hypothetical protein
MIRPDLFADIAIISIGHSRCGAHAESKHQTHLIRIGNLCALVFVVADSECSLGWRDMTGAME